MNTLKTMMLGLVATLCLTVGMAAQAVIIPFDESASDFSSPFADSGFPIDHGVVRTFNFDVGDVLSATISGTWGNSDFSASSAGADIYIDDLLVAQCVVNAACWLDSTGTLAWSYAFTALDLATGILNDGIAQLRVVQTSGQFARIGALNLAGRLDNGIDVPEPGTLSLLGLVLAGLGLRGRKRRA